MFWFFFSGFNCLVFGHTLPLQLKWHSLVSPACKIHVPIMISVKTDKSMGQLGLCINPTPISLTPCNLHHWSLMYVPGTNYSGRLTTESCALFDVLGPITKLWRFAWRAANGWLIILIGSAQEGFSELGKVKEKIGYVEPKWLSDASFHELYRNRAQACGMPSIPNQLLSCSLASDT